MQKSLPTVAVMGLGYVGFPLVELLVKSKKYHVVGVDISKEKVAQRARELRAQNFVASTDPGLLCAAKIIVVCVPTPVYKNYQPDYRPLQGACKTIAQQLQKSQKGQKSATKKPPLVIVESTINPGTCEEVVMPVFQKLGLTLGKNFLLAHAPERIDPGNKKWTIENIPRNVGGMDTVSGQQAGKFYRSFLKAEIKVLSSIRSAEATKIVENTFRDINIAYVNELAMSFDTLKIDLAEVIEGAASKPFSFMPHFPGIGVGGHCIAVDPYYLIERAHKSGFNHRFLKMARSVNNGMPAYTVEVLKKELAALGMDIKKTRIGVLGLAYKRDIEDARESPAMVAVETLKKMKAAVETFDPHIPHLSTVASLEALLKTCPAVILATNHTIFMKKITPVLLKKYGVRVIIDGRNSLNRAAVEAAGVRYKGIGH